MRIVINVPDEKVELMEAAAKAVGAIEITKVDPMDHQIILQGKDVAALSAAVGGKVLNTADEIVKLLVDNFRISVSGTTVDLDPEDAHALKDQALNFDYMSYEDYVRDAVKESMSLYLWGSTRGLMHYA